VRAELEARDVRAELEAREVRAELEAREEQAERRRCVYLESTMGALRSWAEQEARGEQQAQVEVAGRGCCPDG
jgi:hypothetical protein